MIYPGGKDKISGEIVPRLLEMRNGASTYIEPFVGGTNIMWRMAPHFEKAIGADQHQDLILLYQAVQKGWVPPSPQDVTEDLHFQLRNASPSALRGFVGVCCSFRGVWFGGFGDLKQRQSSYNTLLRQMQSMANVRFVHADYRSLTKVGPHCLIYCDPPYYATSGYSSGARDFDSGEFWDHARAWRAQGATVAVSEYQGPPDAQVVWQGSKRVTLAAAADTHRTAIDKLFVLP
jgi:DNA adenine methylase